MIKDIKQIKEFSTKFEPHEVAPIVRGLLSENHPGYYFVVCLITIP